MLFVILLHFGHDLKIRALFIIFAMIHESARSSRGQMQMLFVGLAENVNVVCDPVALWTWFENSRASYNFALIHESAAVVSAGFLIDCQEAAAAKCFL